MVDALAALAWRTPDDRLRRAAMRRLAERYADRGEAARALAAAQAVPLSDDALRELTDGASRAAFARAEGLSSTRARRAALADVVARFPGTEGARRAAEREVELSDPAAADAVRLPAVAMAPAADLLGVAPHLVDGRSNNGEVRAPGFVVYEDRVEWEVDVDGAAVRTSRPVDDAVAAAVNPILEEWEWRRRVARAATFAGAHEGVPVDFNAGVGLDGVTLLPRLLPEVYRGRDRALYEP